MLSTGFIAADADLDHWAQAVLVRFLHHDVTLLPHPRLPRHRALGKEVVVLVLSHVQLFGDPRDCSPPGSSVHGSFPGKNAGVVAISSSRGSPQHRDWTRVSASPALAGGFFNHWATWEEREEGSHSVSLHPRRRQLLSAVQMIQSSSAHICLFSFTYQFIQLYQHGLLAIYFIYTLSYNSIFKLLQLWPVGVLWVGSLAHWCSTISVGFFSFLSFFEHLLTSGATNVRGLSCVFLAPNLDSVISLWSPCSSLECGVRN